MSEKEVIKRAAIELGVDGEAKFNRTISQINASLYKANSSLSKVNAQFGKNTTSAEGLTKKQEALTKKLEAQREKTDALRASLEETAAEYGENSQQAEKLRGQIGYSEAAEQRLENQLKETTAKLQAQQDVFVTLATKAETLSKKLKTAGDQLQKVGKKMTTYVTTPILAAGVAATKTAIDFEDAFAGVRKTVDATEAEYDALKQGIIDMSKEIPASTEEIAAVAEAAGQLGIATEDILDFTKVMINMGESTNLSADEAATALAKFANVSGMDPDDYERLGSVIVELGNNFATTESEIVDMASRLVGTGTQVGMSEAEIMSLATALSSVGIEAEAGGSAMSKVMTNMQLAAAKGGEELEQFAEVAGVSADEFAAAYRENAADALLMFINGLADLEENGGDAIVKLDEMEITEVRMRDALLKAAGASDTFNEALKTGNEAWEDNTALNEEAEKRYETLASQLEIVWNNIKDLARSFGERLMPMVKDVGEWIKKLTDKFNALSDEQKDQIIKWALVAAAIGPVLKITGKLSTGLSGLIGWFGKLVKVIGGSSSLSSLFSPGGWVMLAVTAFGLLATALNDLPGPMDDVYDSMGGMADAAADYQAGIDTAKSALSGFDDSAVLTADRQAELQKSVDDAQNGITELTQKAVDERRGLTEEEFARLQELIDQLGAFADAQLEVYQQKSRVLGNMIKNDGDISLEESQSYLKAVQENMENSLSLYEEQYNKQYQLADEARQRAIQLRKDGNEEEAKLEEEHAQKLEDDADAAFKEQKARLEAEAAELANLVMEKYAKQHQVSTDGIKRMKELSDEYLQNEKDYNQKIAEINAKAEKDGTDHTAELLALAQEHDAKQKAINDEMKQTWNERMSDYAGTLIGMAAEARERGGELTAENKSIVEDILGVYDTLPDEMKEDGRQSLISIADGLKEQFPELANAADMTADELISALKNALGITEDGGSSVTWQLGGATGKSFASGVANKNEDAYNSGSGLATNLIAGAQGGLGGATTKNGEIVFASMFDNGQVAAKSLAAGATSDSALSVLASAGSIMGDTINTAYKKTVKQASPSKLWIKTGKFDVMGLAQGYDDNAKIAAKSAANMATATFNSARAALAKYSGLQMDTTLPDLSGYVPTRRGSGNGQAVTGNQTTINQTNNWTTPKNLSPAETARQNRNALRMAALGVRT